MAEEGNDKRPQNPKKLYDKVLKVWYHFVLGVV
jgi:hypothetical protein